jgi:hypothetical protein
MPVKAIPDNYDWISRELQTREKKCWRLNSSERFGDAASPSDPLISQRGRQQKLARPAMT